MEATLTQPQKATTGTGTGTNTRTSRGTGPGISRRRLRIGLGVSALPALFLLFDSVIKLVKIAPVVESFARLGYPDRLARGVGLLELACLAAYLIPRTAMVGAILLSGFLGGAIATHLRVGDPLVSHALFPSYVGLLIWGGLLLREPRLGTLLPLRRASAPTAGSNQTGRVGA